MDPSRDSHRLLTFAGDPEAGPRFYAFGRFHFDPRDRTLFRDGRNIPLPPKAAELLLLLVRSQGRLLSKETLLAALWPDTFIEESSLSQTIFLLRKALGEEHGIETVPRRGFRFTASVTSADAIGNPVVVPETSRMRIAGVVLVATVVIGTLGVVLGVDRSPVVVAGELLPAHIAPHAREAYLKGRHYWNRRTPADFRKALDEFHAATELEPRFALAWAGLADTYNFLGEAPRAKIAARRALAIDPDCAPALAALANAQLFHDFDPVSADRTFRRALAADPTYATAHHWRAFLLLSQQRYAEARTTIAKARELAPMSAIIATDVGVIDYYARDYDKAVVHLQEALELEPSFVQAQLMLGRAYLRGGQLELAAREVAKHRDIDACANVGLLAARGDVGAASSAATSAERTALETRASPYAIATCFGEVGDAPRAIPWLRRAFATRDGAILLLHVEPAFDRIRAHPEFQRFVREHRL